MARYRQDALELAARGETLEELAAVLKVRGVIDAIPAGAAVPREVQHATAEG